MIALDYGILVTLQAGIESIPGSGAGFRMALSGESKRTLDQTRTVFRFLDGKGHVFASDSLATFTEQQVGDRILNNITSLDESLFVTLFIQLPDNALNRQLDQNFRPQDLSQLEGLPQEVKRLFYIDVNNPTGNPIDSTDLVGLAPSVLKFPKATFNSFTHIRTNTVLDPTDEDDLTVQFNLREAQTGLYEANLNDGVSATRRIYVDPTLFARPPLAVAEVEVPVGNFTLQEYEIEFKKKT